MGAHPFTRQRTSTMLGLSKAHIATAVTALIAFAVVAFVQSQYPIPVVGKYLPR
jgi:hypothetical protein